MSLCTSQNVFFFVSHARMLVRYEDRRKEGRCNVASPKFGPRKKKKEEQEHCSVVCNAKGVVNGSAEEGGWEKLGVGARWDPEGEEWTTPRDAFSAANCNCPSREKRDFLGIFSLAQFVSTVEPNLPTSSRFFLYLSMYTMKKKNA